MSRDGQLSDAPENGKRSTLSPGGSESPFRFTPRGIMYALVFGFALVTLLTACGLAKEEGSHAELHGSEHWQTTASVDTLPSFLDEHTKLTKELYAQVHNHADIMSGINCYCGCMQGTEVDDPHDSLLRCYWVEHPADEGSVTWTDHSTGCGICKMEMEEVIALKKQGKNTDEIREAIDAKFKPKTSGQS